MLPPTDTLEITCAELAALREPGAGIPIRLVDCRELDEWDICHIEGAELCPLSTFAEQGPKRYADETLPIIIYCHHGVRSGNAAHFLRKRGTKNVWSLAGGIEEWACEIEPGMARY